MTLCSFWGYKKDQKKWKHIKSEWYEFIGGCDIHHAILEHFVNIQKDGRSFVWKEISVKPMTSLKQYRIFAFLQNIRNILIHQLPAAIVHLLDGLKDAYYGSYNRALKASEMARKYLKLAIGCCTVVGSSGKQVEVQSKSDGIPSVHRPKFSDLGIFLIKSINRILNSDNVLYSSLLLYSRYIYM